MIREELLALADELEGMDCRIREVVEHDACEDTTVSAYDLLSDEDRKAIAWVREHGGLGAVEKRLMPDGMEWLLDVWPRWSNGEYCKFGDWWKAGEYGEREPQQLSRLTFFTPEKLREWGQDEGENFGYAWDCMRPSDTTYRPDKAEPPALDADGNRIEPAMDVWWICEGDELGIHAEKLHVESIGEDGFVECSPFNGGTWVELDSTELYVHKPVLDADGEPIREGDTVYVLGFGEPLTVKGFADDGRVLMSFHGENSLGYKPSKLTHERPVLDADGVLCREGDEVWEVRSHRHRKIIGTHYRDYETGEPLILCDDDDEIPIPATCVTHTNPEPPDSWERLDEDAEKNPFDYCKDVGHRLDTCENAEWYKARDLVRRAKKLAERGE